MSGFTFTNTDLEKCFFEIEKLLFDTSPSNIYTIKYEGDDTELNYTKNNEIFIAAIKGEPAIYCIWSKPVSQKEFVPVYIGHAKEPRDRMRNHLSKKDKKTGSCLEHVQSAVRDNNVIGITFVKIKPPYMRTAVEAWLISKLTAKNSGILPWNNHGR